jgi:hypothetical protein
MARTYDVARLMHDHACAASGAPELESSVDNALLPETLFHHVAREREQHESALATQTRHSAHNDSPASAAAASEHSFNKRARGGTCRAVAIYCTANFPHSRRIQR